MKLVGAKPQAKVSGLDELPGKSNYFIGNDPKKWRTNVANYAKVKYANVYPGVDLVYYGNQRQLEYDFVVKPGADPRQIVLDVGAGLALPERAPQAAPLHVDRNGDLVVATDGGEVVFHKPVVYQPATYDRQTTKDKHFVDGNYVLKGDQVTFAVASYDKTRPLVIDPVLTYSTYLGGSYDLVKGMAVDTSGNAYITGYTQSSNFPTTPGAFQSTSGAGDEGFVSKLNARGSALVYSTYLGGDGQAVAVDASGNAYVIGVTYSADFPTTPGAFQTACGHSSGFVSKLNAAGSALLYSTYLCGGNGTALAVDASGNAYVAGGADSDLPTTPGAFQATTGGRAAFVSKLNPAGSALVYSTYLGGDDLGTGIAVDASGNAYVTGQTNSSDFPTTPRAFQATFASSCPPDLQCAAPFVSKLNATGSALLYSTYLGGGGFDDRGSGIAVDASGNAYVTGSAAANFPTTPGAFQTASGGGADAFVSKLNRDGSALLYSTYLGRYSRGSGIAVDASGKAYVIGTTSTDFPTTPGALRTTYGGGGDAFVSELNPDGSALLYSTYLGGSGDDRGQGIALDASGNAYVTGWTYASDFPTTPGAFQSTYRGSAVAFAVPFVAKISPADAPGFALGPGQLTFRSQATGTTSAPQTVTLLDAGSQLLSITSIVPSGEFTQTNTCGGAVPAGTACTITVTFTPSATGTRSGAVTITDNAAGSPHNLLLAGTAVSGIPAVALTPTNLTFAPQPVGTTSPAQPATLKNTGSGPLSITAIATAGDFVQTNNCGSTVQPGASCALSVTFKPTATGARSGAITITDNAAGSPQQLLLTGTGGMAPVVTLTPASLTFPAQTVGTTSPAQLATLKNTGNAALNITSIAPAGDFAQSNNCGSTVNPGASCTISVTFAATATGTRSGTISITDNAPGSPQQLLLTGAGGNGPAVSLAPVSLTFAAQPVGTFSPAQSATIKNIGNATLKIISIGRSGDFYEGTNCPSTLLPGASCTLRVTFTPTSPGTRLGTVTISDNAPGSPHKLSLSGTGSGTGSIVLTLSPASLSFGSVAVGATSGTQTVTLTNIGTVAASFLDPFGFASGENLSGFYKNPHCGTSLAPRASCTVSVFFKPLATGTRTAFLLVRQGAASVQIPLSGTGTP